MSELSKVFGLDAGGLDLPRAILFLDLALVPLVVFWAIGHEQYLLSALFGLLLAVLDDRGGSFGHRAARVSFYALIGAGLTAWGFALGGAGWGWLVLSGFAVTLLAGLAVAYGTRRFAAALLLNIWFIAALALAFQLDHHSGPTSHTWAQVVAWAGGSALWLAVTSVGWLARGRGNGPRPAADPPAGDAPAGDAPAGDESPPAAEPRAETARQLPSWPVLTFAVIRAAAVAGACALGFGLDLSYGYWIPVATVIAMKPVLEQTTLVTAQRLVGALLGAAAASLLILLPAGETGTKLFAVTRVLEVVALVLLMHTAAVRYWNHALYCAAVAAGVLILVSLPQPTDYTVEGYRVLWTACGVAIGLGLMLLAGRLAARDDEEP
ncbi:FUSC family protein [Streptomyces sp. NBC_01808]|uniref:FUSC family protein n=1 Tax=Streptomyces sp. NBC_01808 TaxID=2975947 RepID=UPI002DDA5599|nr:FUSC family protein [Streptomyces sp. NBC_01808]WSA40013.1 FUSC family protein [Streptomyces sp. NBC_01808]